MFGFIVSRVWGVGTLLVVLIIISLIAALSRTFGLTQALKLERWARGQFLGHIRGMIIFAILPAIWVVAKDFARNPSISSALVLILVLLLVMVIWERFERIQKGKGN